MLRLLAICLEAALPQSFNTTGAPPFLKGAKLGSSWFLLPAQCAKRPALLAHLPVTAAQADRSSLSCAPLRWNNPRGRAAGGINEVNYTDGTVLATGWQNGANFRFVAPSGADQFVMFDGERGQPWLGLSICCSGLGVQLAQLA